MKITVSIAQVLYDMAVKSHAELETAIPDVEKRYPYEAGTDKREELFRYMLDAISRLHVELQRFCIDPPEMIVEGDDDKDVMDSSTFVTFVLHDSPRRRQEQKGALANLAHTYIADMTLSMFYESRVSNDKDVSGLAQQIAAVRAQEAANSLEMMETYLYSKNRPNRSVLGPNVQ